MRLILASASPRRRELLERVGLTPEVIAAEVDETLLPGENAADYVLRVATDKAHRVNSQLHDDRAAVVVAADTAVVLDGVALGKPADPADSKATLTALSGRSHDVLTAVVAIDDEGIEHSVLASSTVTLTRLSRREIDWYVATGEPLDKAGSYAIQGIGAVLVERMDGDPSTVIGLPLRETIELLRSAGIRWPESMDRG